MTFLTPELLTVEQRVEAVRPMGNERTGTSRGYKTALAARLAVSLALSLAAAGCVTPNISKSAAPIADQPVADEATQFRGYQKSVALWETGTTQGWPTRWYYAPYPDNQTAYNFIADSVMLVVQTFSLPVTLCIDYPFRKVYYEGDVLPASYTAMPSTTEKPYGPPNPDPDPLSMGRQALLPPIPPIPVEHPALVLPHAEPPAEASTTAPEATHISPEKPKSVAPTTRPSR